MFYKKKKYCRDDLTYNITPLFVFFLFENIITKILSPYALVNEF